MSNIWIDALKKWNAKNEKYIVPKKGTKEYDEVKMIMEKMKKNRSLISPILIEGIGGMKTRKPKTRKPKTRKPKTRNS